MGKDTRIDIIVPIYKGQHYIKGMIHQIERSVKETAGAVRCRLVLVNDAPDDSFREAYFSEHIEIITVETDQNRGIHGARVRGLSYCTGEYVVFLDQDDWISPDYFASQMAVLGCADAVVCRAKENGREVYTASYPFQKTVDFENMVSVGNRIVSPGQVLMRREAVPAAWRENILQNNGVDDWFLWLCMMREKCQFVLNEDILFEHRIEGGNLSWDSNKMLLSEKEMLEVIRTKAVLDSEMVFKIESLIASEQQRYITMLEKYRKMFFLYDKWMALECRLGSIADYLYSRNIKKAAIYGMGYIGTQLAGRLMGTCVSLVGAIDRNAGFIHTDVMVVRLEAFEQETDLVIVTVLDSVEAVLQEIRGQIDAPLITIDQLLEDWKQGGGITVWLN